MYMLVRLYLLRDKASTPRGASFNSEKVCLSDTRTVLLDEVWFWIKSIEVKKTAEIL
jgi:hypothetical protein